MSQTPTPALPVYLHEYGFHGDSPAMVKLLRQALLAASSQAPILLQGEVGTGKVALARYLHEHSRRKEGPMVTLTCTELTMTDVNAALERAKGGTLYLDKVIEMPADIQVRSLRVADDDQVRLIAGTAHSLEAAALEGTFRRDLLYRLKVICLDLPAMRDHKQDLPLLWDLALRDAARKENVSVPDVRPQTMSLLLSHDWPGNVFELRNTARHATSQALEGVVAPEHLPAALVNKEERREALRIPGMRLADLERVAILRTYEATGSAKSTAELLDISVRKIHYRLKEYKKAGFFDDMDVKKRGTPLLNVTNEPSGARPRLVLAEDDDQIRWSLAAMLEDEGYDVVSLPSGNAVLEHLGAAVLKETGAKLPDVIVTDVRMPGLNGIRLLEGVRANGWKIPVVLISAFGDDEMREQAAQFEATAFLDKPLDLEQLSQVLQENAPVPVGAAQ
ncbi:MAG: response regulator [Deltaproteobacteria bacterium]|nr:response regulator [Deltaproteobacteria bacterium]